ncbi:MAG: hypothetical protein ABJB01_06100 [Rudaea sp.]
MSNLIRNAALSSERFARSNPVAVATLAIVALIAVAVVLLTQYWDRIDQIRLPNLVGIALGWFIATGTTLGIALLLMWVADRREVNRSRRAMRLNFDHSIMAMLDLAKEFTTSIDRNSIGRAIESSQKQLIAASARLKRFENKLTAFPPAALNAYSELENEIDVTLEDLNDLHRRIRIDRENKFPTFGFEVMDRLTRFNDYLGQIHPRETDASLAVHRTSLESAPVPTSSAVEENAIEVRRA